MNPILTTSKRYAILLITAGTLLATSNSGAEQLGLQQVWVGHELVECPSDIARLCYLVKKEQYEEWSPFEGSIANFQYREGIAYHLLVEVDPSASEGEGPKVLYRVVQVLEEFETFDEPETPFRKASVAEEPVEPVEAPEPLEAPPSDSASPKVDPPASVPPPPESPPSHSTPHGELYRGVLIIGSGTEARSFTPCGKAAGIWVEDESGAGLWSTYRERVAAPNRPLMLEVRGELSPAPSSGFGVHYDLQLTVLEVLRIDAQNTDCMESPAGVIPRMPEGEMPQEVVADQTTADTSQSAGAIEVLIAGAQATWSLSIGSGGIVFSDPAESTILRFPTASPERSSTRATYVTSAPGPPSHALKVVIDREACPDPETGVRRDFTAYLTLDGRWLRGCVSVGNPLPTR